jgi:hypothetical protein
MLERPTDQSINGAINGRNPTFNKTADYLIPKSQLKEAVREVLAEILGVQSQEQTKQWYDIAEAYIFLDLKSAKQLREMIRSGLLRIGYEVRDRRSPNSQVARYQVHIQKSLERLQKPPEKRR